MRVALAAAAVLLFAACGGEESPEADRTVEVEMVDIAFQPQELSVGAGETVRFVFTNQGKSQHEAVIGDENTQAGMRIDVTVGGAPS